MEHIIKQMQENEEEIPHELLQHLASSQMVYVEDDLPPTRLARKGEVIQPVKFRI